MITATATLGGQISVTAQLVSRQVGNCADATITINTDPFGTAPSGGTENIDVVNTLNAPVGSKVAGKWQIGVTPVAAKNSLNQTIASGNFASEEPGVLSLDNVDNVDSTGVTVPTPNGVPFVATPQVKALFLVFDFETGDSETYVHEITADMAGTFTSLSQDGASGTITLSLNGGAYAAFVNPTVLANGDTIQVKRTTTAADGFVKLTGTYV